MMVGKEILKRAYFSNNEAPRSASYGMQCFVIEYSRITDMGDSVSAKKTFPFADEGGFKEQISGYLNLLALKIHQNYRVEFSPEFLQSCIGQLLYLSGKMIVWHMANTGTCASYYSGEMPGGVSSALSVLYSLR